MQDPFTVILMTHPSAHAAHPDARHVDQAELLDLDAQVLAEHTASLTAWLPVAADPRRIVDLGCGTGAGTFALLARFPEAQVIAVDSSPDHLRRLAEKAAAEGVADRVRVVQADLDDGEWPELGTVDLAWASASMHHLADPDRALRKVHRMLAPDGLFAVVELAGFPRFLPPQAPEDAPGLEDRCHAALEHQHAAHLPHRGADWGPMLTAAGFAIAGERTITVDLPARQHDAIGTYALSTLTRLRNNAGHALSAADLRSLDQLLDTSGPRSILDRGDLALRTTRSVWAATRTRSQSPSQPPSQSPS